MIVDRDGRVDFWWTLAPNIAAFELADGITIIPKGTIIEPGSEL